MSWTYVISTGQLYDDQGELVGVGYSGDPSHKNDLTAVSLPSQGPIPPGKYTVCAPHDTEEHGPYVLSLLPDEENEMFGRSGFLIHGDSVNNPGTASEGCIIQSRDVRTQVWESGDHVLEVVEKLNMDYFET